VIPPDSRKKRREEEEQEEGREGERRGEVALPSVIQ